MKNIIFGIMLAVAACCTGAFAADTQYKVYDLSLSLTSTKAGGVVTSSCDDTYAWRTKGYTKIEGIIAGCGCLAATGDSTCNSFAIYLWDAKTKTQIIDFTYNTLVLQRIGKKGEQVEQYVELEFEYPEGVKHALTLTGIGNYKSSKSGVDYDTMSVKGSVTGMIDAPYYHKSGNCGACGESPVFSEQTTATPVCDTDCGLCVVSDTKTTTVAHGTYSFKYNSKRSRRCEKNGLTKSNLGLPSYVEF